jgi:hypothetical protein
MGHCGTAVAQDSNAIVVGPVVQHADEEVDVRAFRDEIMEAPALDIDSSARSRFWRYRRYDVIAVKNQSARRREPGEYATQRLSVATANIDD